MVGDRNPRSLPRSTRVVVSLTTIPGRKGLLDRALASLARQTRPPDAVYLWLPGQRFSADDPGYRFADLEVRRSTDLGPATKILPVLSLEADPDTRIVTVDDDIEYPPELLDRLINASVMLPDNAIGFTGWCLEDDPSDPRVHHRNEDVVEAGMHQDVHVLEGYRGAVYRRGFFEPDVFKHLDALDAFRFHDDILLSGYLASRGFGRTARWFGASCRRPSGTYWKLHGQHMGLHTGRDWYRQGKACLDYWSRLSPDIWCPIPVPSRSERLQLNAQCGPREGFTHHGAPGCRVRVDIVHDLANRPWCWPDSAFSEILAVNEPLRSIDQLAVWLSECARILRPGGVLKVGYVPDSEEAARLAMGANAQRGWRYSWEPDSPYLIGTFVNSTLSD